MIVLTGTSGGLAGVALEVILQKKLLSPKEFRLSSASGQTNSEADIAAGVEVRRGNMREPDTLLSAFDGAEAVFLVSYPSVGEERYELHRNAIDAAKKAGVRHIIYTSLTFGGEHGDHSIAGVMEAHIKTVEYLKSSGVSWTIIRYATYAHLWNNFAGFLQLGDEKDFDAVIPADGPNSWASRRDLGEATAYILKDWREYVGKTITLTGPQLLTIKDVVKLYQTYSGRTVNIQEVGAERAAEYHTSRGTLPPDQTTFLSNWASWHVAMAQGEVDYVDPMLEKLLGRKPVTVEEMADTLFNHEKNGLDTKDFV